jgi:hypothetical protein
VSRLALSKGPHRVGVFLPSPEDETDSISKTMGFIAFRIPNNGKSPIILRAIFIDTTVKTSNFTL